MTLAQELEQVASLGIFFVATTLLVLSALAWRREHVRRMAVVSVAYAMFALYGLIVFLEYYLITYHVSIFLSPEILEHASSFLILIGLLAFFVALVGE